MERSVPRHVAIIMDGNGRWAQAHGKPRTYGHYVGANNVRNIALKANDMGIEVLTLYAFSTENWKRPEGEVSYLMSLPAVFFAKYMEELMDNGIRFRVIGDLAAFPEATRRVLEDAMERSHDNTRLQLVFAMNYGGRQDIVRAAEHYAQDRTAGRVSGPLTEQQFSRYLYTADFPEVDLLIRTSLDYRLSNFLLWQVSYTELYFTEHYWPEFTTAEFEQAVADFSRRQRRFGGLK